MTPDEIGDPHALSIKQTLNGNIMQSSNTSEMIFSVFDIISFISSSLILKPGDVIATGTPEGVGIYRDPPVFLVDGDVVEIEIERLGMLRNHVRRYEQKTAGMYPSKQLQSRITRIKRERVGGR